MANSAPMHPAVEPLKWLIGKWVTNCGAGIYPTITNFKYCEEIIFTSFGQPLLSYSAKSWHPEKKNTMHCETGFLRIKPGSKEVSLMVAHNFGLTTLEEGLVDESTIQLKCDRISRMSFAKDPSVTKLERVFTLKDGSLEQVVHMETSSTSLTEHLRATYEKVQDV